MSMAVGSSVVASDGRRFTLAKLLKSGGAGGVYQLRESAALVAKIYHEAVENAVYERKVLAMLSLTPDLPPLTEGGRQYVQIAWPTAVLRDPKGRFLGFLMPTVDVAATSELEYVLQEKQARRLALPTGLGAKVTLAANLAAVITELHRRQHRVVDLKPVNLRFYTGSLYMAMLDCDGFSIQGEGERFPAPQFTVDYLAPEFQNTGLNVAGEEQQDRFALAVVVFQLLNFGIHPFSGRPVDDRVPTDIPSRIGSRFYAYGIMPHPRIAPNPASGHTAMPQELRQLLDRAFQGPAAARPTAQEWSTLLRLYAQRAGQLLTRCPVDASHQYFTGFGCAACARAGLIAGARKAARGAGRGVGRAQARLPGQPAAPASPPRGLTAGNAASRVYGFAPPPVVPYALPVQLYNPLQNWPVVAPQKPVPPVVAVMVFGFVVFLACLGWINGEPHEPYVAPPYVTHRSIPPPFALSPTAVPDADDSGIVQPGPAAAAALASVSPVAGNTREPEAAPLLPQSVIARLPMPARLSEWMETQGHAHLVAIALAAGDYAGARPELLALSAQASRHPRSAAMRASAATRFVDFMQAAPAASAERRVAWMQELRAQIDAQPYDAELASEWGWLALLSGSKSEAEEAFVRAIWAQPERPDGWYGLGAVATSDRIRYGALTVFEELRAFNDPEPQALGSFTSTALALSQIDYRRFRILLARGRRNSLSMHGEPIPAFVNSIANQALDPRTEAP